MDESLSDAIASLSPILGLRVRQPLDGGQSGATVYLAECELSGESRMAVVKLASLNQADAEEKGDAAARASWLAAHMPDHFRRLGTLPGTSKVAILSTLARDRMEDCRTLAECLHESYHYAIEYPLLTLAYLYRSEANRTWHAARTARLRECFQTPLANLGNDWQSRWSEANLPPAEFPSFIFDDAPARLPNPVAFLFHADFWTDNTNPDIRVPWLQSHGDLNPRNVLCPSYLRAIAGGLLPKGFQPLTFVEWIKLIDMPFTRLAPYMFDLAFLLSSTARILLPTFDNRPRRDIVIASYEGAIQRIATGQTPPGVPQEGVNFVDCVGRVWDQVRFAQPRMESDIERGFLACLSAAGLWQAVKAVNRQRSDDRDRQAAVALLMFSAVALKRALGVDRLPGPNFDLWPTSLGGATGAWTPGASALAREIQKHPSPQSLILVLGRGFPAACGLPPESDWPAIRKGTPTEISAQLATALTSALTKKLACLGSLPLAAVIDWSIFPQLRDALASGALGSRQLVRVLPGQKGLPDWKEKSNLPYFHWRGSLEELNTVAYSAPERTEARVKLRPGFDGFSKRHGQALTAIYAGVPENDLREIHEFLEELWRGKLRAVWLGEPTEAAKAYLSEWGIPSLPCGIDDLLSVACELAEPHLANTRHPSQRLLEVANMARDAQGELVASVSETLILEVPDSAYNAITRAGTLLLRSEVERLAQQERDPRDFLVGHRVLLSEVHEEVPVERDVYRECFDKITAALQDRRPSRLEIPCRPGAGGSTALRWLAYHLAFEAKIPVLILNQGGNSAFEAFERLYALVGRSFIVVADPEDVPADEQSGLLTRCGPPRLPVLFVTYRRDYRPIPSDALPYLDMALSDPERISLLERFVRYCRGVNVGALNRSPTRSLFLLTLEAFGLQSARLRSFVSQILAEAKEEQRFLVKAVAFFARYAHRPCSLDFLQMLCPCSRDELNALLQPFDQLILLAEEGTWTCRHEEISECILQFLLVGEIAFKPDPRHNAWRYQLADLACSLIDRCDGDAPGGLIATDYIWAVLNPQLEAYRASDGSKVGFCRLMQGPDDGIPESAMRARVYDMAANKFPAHINIVSHYGKFLSEEQGKFIEAEEYLERARQFEPHNKAVLHMLGMRYFDEVRQVLRQFPPNSRPVDIQDRLLAVADAAQHWFGKSRDEDAGNEHPYDAAIRCDIELIEDEFRRIGIRNAGDRPDALVADRIATWLSHAQELVGAGLRYLPPDNRAYFSITRDRLRGLRGDLDGAIKSIEQNLHKLSGPARGAAYVQLARYYLERGEKRWLGGENKGAYTDFDHGQRYMLSVLEDPARRGGGLLLWYQCAWHMRQWRRQDFLDRLHNLHEIHPSLDSAFLLMCWYFADAAETASAPSWRKYQEYQIESARRASNLSIRTYIREWLVEVQRNQGTEYGVMPHHLISREEGDETAGHDLRVREHVVRLNAIVDRILSSTQGYLKLEVSGFELFFKPRIRIHGEERAYYASDVGRQKVTCAVAFTYDKPIAYDVKRV